MGCPVKWKGGLKPAWFNFDPYPKSGVVFAAPSRFLFDAPKSESEPTKHPATKPRQVAACGASLVNIWGSTAGQRRLKHRSKNIFQLVTLDLA